MKNTQYSVIWISARWAFNCTTFSVLWHFLKFENGVEAKPGKLHFLSLHQIPNIFILKVTNKSDQGASTFRMRALWRVNIKDIFAYFLCTWAINFWKCITKFFNQLSLKTTNFIWKNTLKRSLAFFKLKLGMNHWTCVWSACSFYEAQILIIILLKTILLNGKKPCT